MSTTSAAATTTSSSPSATSASSTPSISANSSSTITTTATATPTTDSSIMSTSTSTPDSSVTTSSSMSSTSSAPPTSTSTTTTTTTTSESSTSTSSTSTTSSATSTTSSTSSFPTTSSTATRTTTSQMTTTTTAPTTFLSPSSTPPAPSTTTTLEPSSVAPPTLSTTMRATDMPTDAVFTQTTITSILTTTSNGQVITITEVSVSQTLSPNKSGSQDNSFFKNTGAVAGVFVVVGLAAASIFLWILFALRRRRRTRRLEHDTAVSATLAAAGFHRTPLDDDDDDNENTNGSRRSRLGSPEIEMRHRTSSALASSTPSGARTSAYMDSPHPDDPDAFNPYRDYVVDGTTGNLPPSAFYPVPYRDRTSSGGEHIHNHSASGSLEPLLTSYYRQGTSASSPALAPGPRPPSPPSPPPRNPLRLSGAGRRSPPLGVLAQVLPETLDGETKVKGENSSVYSMESLADDRLDPGLRNRIIGETDRASQRDFKDEEDYSRPVLGVRNLPMASEASQIL